MVESRTLSYGIAGSLAVHLLLFLMLALWMQFPVSRPVIPQPQELDKEVTLLFPQDIKVEPPPPAPEPPKTKKEPERYIRTTQNDDAPAPPTKSDFISDRNTVASAKMAPDPKGDMPLPSMNGVNVPTLELANRDYKDGQLKNDNAASTPKMQASPPTPPAPKPELRSPEPELALQQPTKSIKPPSPQLAKDQMPLVKEGEEHLPLEVKKPVTKADMPPEPPPAPDAAAPAVKAIPVADPVVGMPKPDKDAFMPQTRTSKVKGTISNRGNDDAVNAASSPTGRYMRQVTSAIEKKWHLNRRMKADFVEPGKLRLHFYVNKNGKPEDLKIVFAEANAVMTDFTISSILEAGIPPIPKDLLPILDKERFEIEYDVVIY
jgi:hypothetical protein